MSIRTAYTTRPLFPFVLDALLVVVFAVIGRASHDLPLTFGGILTTAAPFLLALLLAWAIVMLTKLSPSKLWPAGVAIWVVTVTSGLALRVLFGDTAAVPFMLVTTGVLAVFVLLPRVLLHSNAALASADTK